METENFEEEVNLVFQEVGDKAENFYKISESIKKVKLEGAIFLAKIGQRRIFFWSQKIIFLSIEIQNNFLVFSNPLNS